MVRPRPLVKGVASHLSGSQTAKKRRAGGYVLRLQSRIMQESEIELSPDRSKTNWQADGGDTLGVPGKP